MTVSALAAACGGSSESSTPDASTSGCVPNQSIACVGPGGCAGGQACKSDGTGYSLCDCGAHPDSGTVDADPGQDSGGSDAATADAGPLSPDQIPGLSVWFDSAKGTTVDPANLPKMLVWADQSSHGNNAKENWQNSCQLLVSGYKAFDVVRCESANSFLIDDDASLRFGTGPFAFVTVLRLPLAISGSTPLWNKPDATGLQITVGQAVTVATPTASAAALLPTPTAFHVIAVRGPAMEVRIDGVATKGTTSTSDVSGTPYQVRFGAWNGLNRVEYLQLIAYKGVVSDLQMAGLEAYLAAKYGL